MYVYLLKLNRARIGPYSGSNCSLKGQYRAGGGRTYNGHVTAPWWQNGNGSVMAQ